MFDDMKILTADPLTINDESAMEGGGKVICPQVFLLLFLIPTVYLQFFYYLLSRVVVVTC
ncbi:MAG: hypothetical protein ACI8RD_008237 [Bacillariaceae sp.]|jgi:hypothetical protein